MHRFQLMLCSLTLLCTGLAHAWGPAVHAYIASKAVPDASPAVLFGACLADMFSFEGKQSPLRGEVKSLTHRKFDLLPPCPLTLGILTHNSAWGADFYAHQHERDPEHASFPTDVMLEFARAEEMDIDEAEDYIEPIMDYAVRRVHGPEIGQRLLDAAQAVGPKDFEPLLDVLAPQLAKRAKGMTQEECRALLSGLFESYRAFLAIYGRLLLNDDATLERVGIDSFILTWGVNRTLAERRFRLAISLCEAQINKLDPIAAEIAERLKKESFLPAPLHEAPVPLRTGS